MQQLNFLLLYAKKYTGTLIITIISMLALVGVQLLIPWIIRTMVDAVTGAEGAFNQALVTRLALFALAVHIARALLQLGRSYLAHVAGWGVVAKWRKVVYEY